MTSKKGGSGSSKGGGGKINLMHSYYFYAALLAIKLLALIPMGCWLGNSDKFHRANLTDLKHLTPFWLVAALYVTTAPDTELCLNLMRLFFAARVVAAASYVCYNMPQNAMEGAFFTSFCVTAYMAMSVVASYYQSY